MNRFIWTRSLLLSWLLALSIVVQGQNWNRLSLDEAVSVELPEGFQEMDTLVNHDLKLNVDFKTVSWSAETDYGILTVSKTPAPPKMQQEMVMQTEADLLRYYEGMLDGNRRSGLEILEQEYVHWDSLVAMRMLLSLGMEGDTMYVDARAIYLNHATYQFQYSMRAMDASDSTLRAEVDYFMQSIHVATGLGPRNQYGKHLKAGWGGLAWNVVGGMALGLAIMTGLVVLLVRYLVRRRELDRSSLPKWP